MGQSTNATLFYGYCWQDEHHRLFDDDDGAEWYEILAKRRLIPNPWGLYRSSGAEASHRVLPYRGQEDAYREWKREVGFDALLAAWDEQLTNIKVEYAGVEVGRHCSGDYPMPYIYIADSELTAHRGHPVAVDPLHTAPESDGWNKSLAKFVADLDIDISEAQGPGWFLVSYMG